MTLIVKRKAIAPTKAQISELTHCYKDVVHFINNYCYIKHPTRGTIKFETYPFQDKCIKSFRQHLFNIVLKSRQLGLSTVTAAYVVHMALFNRDKNILCIATKLSIAQNFIKKVATILDNLPPWMMLSGYKKNEQEIKFDNGSNIKAVPTTDDAGRSEALSLLVVDEAAIIRNFGEIWPALFPTLSEGGAAIILSTPNGAGGQYYDLWTEAITNGLNDNSVGANGFHPIKLLWDVHPEHDQDYFDKMSLKLGPRKTAQELLCDFLSSGDTFLKSATLQHISNNLKEPLVREGTNADVWVWERPVPSTKYIIAADVARGDANDNSTFVCLNCATGEIVCEYAGKIYPDALAELLVEYSKHYNNALLVVESNTFGHHALLEITKLKYHNLFYRTAPTYAVENYYPNSKDKPGFDTTAASRTEALLKMEESLRNRIVVSYSKRFYVECQTFLWIENKPQARKGQHDDVVMAMAIASWVYRTYFEEYRLSQKNNAKQDLKEIKKSGASMCFPLPSRTKRLLDPITKNVISVTSPRRRNVDQGISNDPYEFLKQLL